MAFLRLAEIARWHHGTLGRLRLSGWPCGAGDSAGGALMALADVGRRTDFAPRLQTTVSLEQARRIIAAGRGTHFDPDVTDAFLDAFEQIAAVARDPWMNPEPTPYSNPIAASLQQLQPVGFYFPVPFSVWC